MTVDSNQNIDISHFRSSSCRTLVVLAQVMGLTIIESNEGTVRIILDNDRLIVPKRDGYRDAAFKSSLRKLCRHAPEGWKGTALDVVTTAARSGKEDGRTLKAILKDFDFLRAAQPKPVPEAKGRRGVPNHSGVAPRVVSHAEHTAEEEQLLHDEGERRCEECSESYNIEECGENNGYCAQCGGIVAARSPKLTTAKKESVYTDELLLNDGEVIYGCRYCDFTHEKATSVAAHGRRSHKFLDEIPVADSPPQFVPAEPVAEVKEYPKPPEEFVTVRTETASGVMVEVQWTTHEVIRMVSPLIRRLTAEMAVQIERAEGTTHWRERATKAEIKLEKLRKDLA